MLNKKELQAVEDLLVLAGSKLSAEERSTSADILATARFKFKCDNHELHRMYSEQKHRKEKS